MQNCDSNPLRYTSRKHVRRVRMLKTATCGNGSFYKGEIYYYVGDSSETNSGYFHSLCGQDENKVIHFVETNYFEFLPSEVEEEKSCQATTQK